MAAKAPERVKHEIVNKPVKFGGYGMLDVIKLDESLKIKALGRFFGTNHPFLRIIKSKKSHLYNVQPYMSKQEINSSA